MQQQRENNTFVFGPEVGSSGRTSGGDTVPVRGPSPVERRRREPGHPRAHREFTDQRNTGGADLGDDVWTLAPAGNDVSAELEPCRALHLWNCWFSVMRTLVRSLLLWAAALWLCAAALLLDGRSVEAEGGDMGEGAGLRRVKRGWMWNQFFLQEEYTGSDYQYIGKLQSDQDRGDSAVKYILSGEGAGSIFVLDEENGDLHATRRLDREEKSFYVLRATVVNKRTGLKLEPETEFVIKLHDINDNEPTFSQEVYTGSVPERADIGTSVIQVTATDADDSMYGNSAKLVYSISQGHPYFSVDPNTGEQPRLQVRGPLPAGGPHHL
uniref:Cadherin domain-containing protein n=1 Tax=Knipowitschia caucasica TaxID=637954 RepID=A0AAV2JZC1_KNICA